MTERPELKNWITTGNFLTIAFTLVSIGGLYTKLDARLLSTESIVVDHEMRLRAKEAAGSINATEIAVELAKINARLTSIEKAVKP